MVSEEQAKGFEDVSMKNTGEQIREMVRSAQRQAGYLPREISKQERADYREAARPKGSRQTRVKSRFKKRVTR